MSGADTFGFLVLVAGIVIITMSFVEAYKHRLRLREAELKYRTVLASEDTAHASEREALEARVRVLERIVTDPAAQVARQIETLRAPA